LIYIIYNFLYYFFQIENENPHQATANVQKLRKDIELVKNEQLLLLKTIKNLKI